jgi:Uncharacterised nucleotidyltransferase
MKPSSSLINDKMGEVPTFLMDALCFQDPDKQGLRNASDAEWTRVLSDWHTVRLTLPLRRAGGDEMPLWVRERIDTFLADNTTRFERIKEAYSRAAKALDEAGVDHLVIKGFSLWPGYTEHPKYRPQSDIDLYCRPETVVHAREALLALGYTTKSEWGRLSPEHLSPLIPPQSWTWRGNYFDPEIPAPFELHFAWWDGVTTRLHPQGPQDFWRRRVRTGIDDVCFPALDPVDNLGYTAINLLRNLLGGYAAVEQVYSLARFLHTFADDRPFWQRWRTLHHDSLRRLEAISFLLASQWFACRLSEEAQEEVDRLSPAVHRFFRHFSKAALSTEYLRTKDGLWLHLELLESKSEKAAVLLQRVFPARASTIPPLPADDAAQDTKGKTYSRPDRLTRKSVTFAKWFIARGLHHLLLLGTTLRRGLAFRLAPKDHAETLEK